MKPADFDKFVSAAGLNSRSVAACRLVLVDGLGVREAARRIGGIDASSVSRMLKKIPREVCKCCGGAITNFISNKKT